MQSNTNIICPSTALCPANFSFTFSSLLSRRCWASFIRIWLACSLAAWWATVFQQPEHPQPNIHRWCTQQHQPSPLHNPAPTFSHRKFGLDPRAVLCFTSINPTILPAGLREFFGGKKKQLNSQIGQTPTSTAQHLPQNLQPLWSYIKTIPIPSLQVWESVLSLMKRLFSSRVLPEPRFQTGKKNRIWILLSNFLNQSSNIWS